jgi:hypothetical protein
MRYLDMMGDFLGFGFTTRGMLARPGVASGKGVGERRRKEGKKRLLTFDF